MNRSTVLNPSPPSLEADGVPRVEPESRWAVLALLRFYLAACVASEHLTFFVPAGSFVTALGRLGPMSRVLGFLFVSGYSIHHSLLRRPDGFYGRRIARIYPLYALCIVFSFIGFYHRGFKVRSLDRKFYKPTFLATLTNLAFLQNWIDKPLQSNEPIWSMSIEVAFYILAPLLVLASNRALIAVILASAAAFVFHQHEHFNYFSFERGGLPVLFLAWAWVGGFCLYRERSNTLAVAGMIALCAVLMNIHTDSTGPYAVTSTCTALCVVAICHRVKLLRRLHRPARFLGDLSYPLYLFHIPVLIWAQIQLHIYNQWGLAALILAVSFGAMLLDNQIQRLLPVVLRHRLFKTEARPVLAG